MAGLYIHIPFCKQKCSYCNFHFSTTRKWQQQMVDAMCTEVQLRKDFFPSPSLSSIYFGGGTPSLLTRHQITAIFNTIREHFSIAADAEVTLEANPDDLTLDFLNFIKNDTPINRLSVGVQSFNDRDLKLMNRAHSHTEALTAIHQAKKVGFDDFNMDLIFGIPGQSMADWEANLQIFLDLELNHISCYSLTIEENTAFHHWIQKGQMQAPSNEDQADFFLKADEILTGHGYDHYEISNYCKNGHYARHNTSYWKGVPYLGIGPSAHSFDGKTRQFNPAHNIHYLQALQKGNTCYEGEQLSKADRYNEYLLTGLRTKWGIQKSIIAAEHADFCNHFKKESRKWIHQGLLVERDDQLVLSTQGQLLSDTIMADLFY